MNRYFLVLATAATLSTFACEKSAKETQETADKAQAEAQRKISNATAEASSKVTSAEVDAKKKIAEAEGDFAKTREDYRHTTQEHLDAIDKDIADLDAKAKKATGKTKADLDTQLTTLKAQRMAFGEDVKSLETSTAMTWDTTKARVDKEWQDLKAAVDHAKIVK